MRAAARVCVGLAAALGVAVLSFDIAGDIEPIRNLVLAACACLAIAAPLFFVHDHQRKKQVYPDAPREGGR